MILTNTEILLLDSLTQISLPSCSARPCAQQEGAIDEFYENLDDDDDFEGEDEEPPTKETSNQNTIKKLVLVINYE